MTSLTPVALLLFPDLGQADPKWYDLLNFSVAKFHADFRQSGYCVVTLPSGTYSPLMERDSDLWCQSHISLVEGKLKNLINHMILLCGRRVGRSKWLYTRATGNYFKGMLKYRPTCSQCTKFGSKCVWWLLVSCG